MIYASDTLKQQLTMAAVVGSFERLLNSYSAGIGMWHQVEFQPLYANQISVKVALGSDKADQAIIFIPRHRYYRPSRPRYRVISSNSAMDG